MARKKRKQKTTKTVYGPGPLLMKLLADHKEQFERTLRERIEEEINRQLSDRVLNRIAEPERKPFVWKTYEGVSMKVSEMEESHLQNAINWCQRILTRQFGNTRWMSDTKKTVRALYEFLEEAERRGLKV